MRLEIIRRTMQALVDVDLAFAERIMEIAESMAESHPRILRDKEIDDLYLNPSRFTREQLDAIYRPAPEQAPENDKKYIATYTAERQASLPAQLN